MYEDGSPHKDFGNIFLEKTPEPQCEEDIYKLENEIQKDIKNRIGFARSSVTIIYFKLMRGIKNGKINNY